jgi:hypothetical protein
MARRKQEKCDFNMLYPSVNMYDLIVSCFQESKGRDSFIDRLNKFMENNGFKQMKMVYMLEMFVIAFIKKSKQDMLNGVIQTQSLPCGKDVGGIIRIGNKGGLQMHFKLNEMHFNFIACHLLHGQHNREKRDEMMG